MKNMTIRLTETEVRHYDYYLGLRYGKKSLREKIILAVMEIACAQALEESQKAESKIK
jgi:hypothetical protein